MNDILSITSDWMQKINQQAIWLGEPIEIDSYSIMNLQVIYQSL